MGGILTTCSSHRRLPSDNARSKADGPLIVERNLLRENAPALLALGFMTFIAVTKTLLTKYLFMHVHLPIAFSVMSCVATVLCFLPIFAFRSDFFAVPRWRMLPRFLGVCLAIAIDLGCTNVAISVLSLALQQCIKATSPAATIFLESLVTRKVRVPPSARPRSRADAASSRHRGARMNSRPQVQHPLVYLVVLCICAGPVLTRLGSPTFDGSLLGIVMMVAAVIAGAFKYVLAHKIVTEYRHELGTLAFTFWVRRAPGPTALPQALDPKRCPRARTPPASTARFALALRRRAAALPSTPHRPRLPRLQVEVFVALMLAPWALLSGEAEALVYGTATTSREWALLWFTAAYGGVRIFSQFAFLKHTSATALAMSNLAIQALTILLGIALFGTEVTPFLAAGVSVTLFFSTAYTYLKVVVRIQPLG